MGFPKKKVFGETCFASLRSFGRNSNASHARHLGISAEFMTRKGQGVWSSGGGFWHFDVLHGLYDPKKSG